MLKNLGILFLGLLWFGVSMWALDQQDIQRKELLEIIEDQSNQMVFMFDCQMAEKKRADFVVGRLVRSWHDMNKLKTGKYLSDADVVYSLNKLYGEMGKGR